MDPVVPVQNKNFSGFAKKACKKSSWGWIRNLKSFTLTIQWNLAKPVKTYHGSCKYCQLDMNASHDHDDENDCHTTSRFQPTRQRVGALPQSHPGLCGTPVGPGMVTHGTGRAVHWKAVGGAQPAPRRPTKTRLSQTCFQPPLQTHLESCMVAELVP